MSKRKNFDQHAKRIAGNLRRMADEIEHELEYEQDISDTSQAIIGTVTWGVANLQLGLLLRWTVRVIEEQGNE